MTAVDWDHTWGHGPEHMTWACSQHGSPMAVRFLTWELRAPKGSVPTERVAVALPILTQPWKFMQSHFCYIGLVINKSQVHLDSTGGDIATLPHPNPTMG